MFRFGRKRGHMTDRPDYPVVLTYRVPKRFALLTRLAMGYWEEQEIVAKANLRGWEFVSRELQSVPLSPTHPGHESENA